MSEEYPLKNLILPQSRVNEWEKDELLESALNEEKATKKQGLGLKELKIAFFIVFFVLVLCAPKIYLANTIYYLSKDIINLRTQYDILLDENKRLKHEVESLRYKFLILKKPSDSQ